MEIRTEGFAELDELLGQLPERLRRPVLLRAMRKAGKPLADEVAARAPRGKDPRRRGANKQRKRGDSAWIGAAADSIKLRAEPAESETSAALAIGPDKKHWYLKFAERGSAHQPAKPFIRPTFDAGAAPYLERLGSSLWSEMKRAVVQLRRGAEKGTLGDELVDEVLWP